jgi:hypothetical protein
MTTSNSTNVKAMSLRLLLEANKAERIATLLPMTVPITQSQLSGLFRISATVARELEIAKTILIKSSTIHFGAPMVKKKWGWQERLRRSGRQH